MTKCSGSGQHPFDWGTSSRESSPPSSERKRRCSCDDCISNYSGMFQSQGSSAWPSSSSVLSSKSEKAIGERIMNGAPSFDFWPHWDPENEGEHSAATAEGVTNIGTRPARSLILSLLQKDPVSRLTASGALNSSWILKDLAALRRLYDKKVLGTSQQPKKSRVQV